jgi:hypothetical protein
LREPSATRASPDTDGRLVARVGPLKALLLALGSALFVVCGLGIGYAAVLLVEDALEPYRHPVVVSALYLLVAAVYLLLAVVCVGFFGYALLFFLGRLMFFWRPALVVGSEGLYDDASALGAGWIRWEEIGGARLLSYGGQPYIALRLRDEAAFLSRQPQPKRWLIRLNRRRFTGATVNIPTRFLDADAEELLEEISDHLHRRRGT